MGVRDAATIADTEVRLRGEAEQLGPVVPRGYLSVVSLKEAPPIPNDQSGRLQLAEWLTRPDNPLTARVIVNRVWQHLFGQGLVASVDNFGVTGDPPTHPELLDYLASRFVAEGWSIKTLVRELVLTRAYQLSADEEPANLELDPANRFVWRHAPRRLDAEELRDATLAAAHALDAARPEASLARDLKVVELLDSSPVARKLEAAARKDAHRSVYLPLVRGLTPTSLAVFDFAEQGMVTGDRDTTTVATQALYLLNDSFVRRNAVALAETLLDDDRDDAQRITLAYRRILGRAPTADETQRVLAYVADFEIAATAIAPADAQLAAAAPSAGDEAEANLLAGGGDPVEPPQNPDELPPVEAPVIEESIGPLDSKAAAWASFCQALFGSAEFRYTK